MSGDWDLGPGTGIWVSGDQDLDPRTRIWVSGDRDLGIRGPGFVSGDCMEGIGEPWRLLERPGDAQKPGLWGRLEPFARFWGARELSEQGWVEISRRFWPPPVAKYLGLRT